MSGNGNNSPTEKKRTNGRDVAVFLLSLLLALGIWFAHNLALSYSGLISVPVVAESNIEGHSAESSNSCMIVARCRTTGYSFISKRRLSDSRPVKVYFAPGDLHEVEDDMFTLSANDLTGYVGDIFGDDVRLESFVSTDVQFRFPKENHKVVPVQVISTVSFKPQYMASEPLSVEPDSVTVYGEPSTIQNIDRVLTETISLQNLSSSPHGMAKLESPLMGVRLSASEVSYSMAVSRFVEVKARVKVSVRNVPPDKVLSVYPSMAEVGFKCAFPLLSDPSEEAELFIDYNDFVRSINGRCIPQVSGLRSDVLDYSIEPQVFECIENIKQ